MKIKIKKTKNKKIIKTIERISLIIKFVKFVFEYQEEILNIIKFVSYRDW